MSRGAAAVAKGTCDLSFFVIYAQAVRAATLAPDQFGDLVGDLLRMNFSR